MKPGETKRCEACQEPLIGAETAKGEVAPIEHAPHDDGNVLLFRQASRRPLTKDAGTISCRVFTGPTLDDLRRQGVPMRRNHFASCSDPERFKRSAA